jgi:hypothetical protein
MGVNFMPINLGVHYLCDEMQNGSVNCHIDAAKVTVTPAQKV